MASRVDWHIIEATEAIFKSYTDDGKDLSVYIHSQLTPIVCTSGHRDKCLKALSIVEQLDDGDQIKYYTKGANTPGWKEKYFYRLEKINGSSSLDIDDKSKDSVNQFKGGVVIEHTNNGKGIIKEVIERGATTQLKVLFYLSNEEMLIVLNTSTMSVIDEAESC